MTSISMIDLFIIVFVLVDDWYKVEGVKLLRGKAGAKPEFTDSEMITLMLVQEFIPFPSETQFLGFIRANYLALFPKLVDQSHTIGVPAPYAYWWNNYGGIGSCKKAGTCIVATCSTPNLFRSSATNVTNGAVTSPDRPVMASVPAVTSSTLATSWWRSAHSMAFRWSMIWFPPIPMSVPPRKL